MERLLERGLFASRWMMAPMYLGLVLALVILVWIFLMELWRFVLIVPVMTVNDAILGVLALIDLSLAANPLLIVIFSGYENFVSKIDAEEHKDWPDWMGKIDFTGLKLKLLSSIVAISAIQVLKAFMDLKNISDRDLMWSVTIHMVFVVSGVILALTDRISESGHKVAKAKGSASGL
jgi:uncharacterized protein (TIGR00645 family)